MHRLQPTARPGLGRTKVRQAAECAGSQHVAGGRTGAGGGRRFPQRGPAGPAGPEGVGGGRRGLGRGVGWREARVPVTSRTGRVVCRYPSAGAAGPSSGAETRWSPVAWERIEEFLLESAWMRRVEGPRRLGDAGRKVSVCVQCRASEVAVGRQAGNSYLPGRGDTMITKVVFPGRGLSIALRMC